MGRKKTKPSTATDSSALEPDAAKKENILDDPFFPFLRYTSVVGVHTTLLIFAVLFLPQSASTKLFANLYTGLLDDDFASSNTTTFFSKAQQTSADRPPSQFVANLTASPGMTMVCVCLGSGILQAWWAGWLRTWAIDFMLSEKGVIDEQDRKLEIGKIDQTKYITILHAWIATFAASGIFHLVFILFGSPITSHVPHTYLLALTFACLTVFPPAYTLGVPKSTSLIARLTWTRLYAELSPRNPIERALVYPTVGASIGCWAGAIPCALDWDRPWQAWPLPLAFGALMGYIFGTLIALTVSAVEALAEIGRNARFDEDLRVAKEEAERGRSRGRPSATPKKEKKEIVTPVP